MMPTFSFTSPEGKTYDIEGPEGATQEQAFGILQQHMQQNPPSTGERAWNTAKRATGLTARALATGAAGLATTVADPIMGLANIGRNIGYKVAGKPMPEQMKMPSVALQDVMTSAGLPNAETLPEKALMMAGAIAGGRFDPASKALAAKIAPTDPLYQPPRLSDKQQTIRQGMEAGYKVAPSQAAGGAGPVARMAEAFGGAPQVQDIVRSKNQLVTDQLLKKAAGLPKDAHLNKDTLDGALAATFKQTYEPIKSLPRITNGSIYRQNLMKALADYGDAAPGAKNEGVQNLVRSYLRRDFTGEQAVNDIKTLRSNADKAFRSSEPGSNELALANKAIANAIEDSIELNLARTPGMDTGLMNQFRAGRKLMAKQHVVKESVLEGTGSGSALHLAAALQRGAPLTDELRTIGKMANVAPGAMKMPTTDPKLFNTWETGTGAYGVGRLMSGDMSGAFFAGLPVGRLAARQGLATAPVQNMMKPSLDPNILSRLGSKQGVIQSLPAAMQQYGLFMQPDQQ